MRNGWIFLMTLAFFFLSCAGEDLNADDLQRDFFSAFESGSYDLMQHYYTQLSSVNDLVDNDLRFEIFRYKILALSSMAEYGKIQELLKHEQYTDKVEYWIAKAFLCEIFQDSSSCIDDYGEALELILKRKQESKSEVASSYLPAEIYIRRLIEPGFEVDIVQVDKEYQEIITYYTSLNRDQLLLSSPFFIFYTRPHNHQRKDADTEWWIQE